MNKHIKTTFPSGWYHFCCTHIDEDDHFIYLTFTCDVGERAYQHIIMSFHREHQAHQIAKMNDRARFVVHGDPRGAFYSVQYLTQRCEAKVDSIVRTHGQNSFITNTIADWKPVMVEPDWNVMKPKVDTMFFKTKNKKKLPI